MFTGIIEAMGRVEKVESDGSNRHFCFASPLSNELKVDQSISHNGVCLTVTKADSKFHWVTAVDETLIRSNLGSLMEGDMVNLERCMLANGRFDGHIVQGHVDHIGTCVSIKDVHGSWLFDFEYAESSGNITVEKGSISINGVSLTCFDSKKNGFTVAIIPYTFHHTNFRQLGQGGTANLEFDVLGKYIQKIVGTAR